MRNQWSNIDQKNSCELLFFVQITLVVIFKNALRAGDRLYRCTCTYAASEIKFFLGVVKYRIEGVEMIIMRMTVCRQLMARPPAHA
jgi:hypothetical protein